MWKLRAMAVVLSIGALTLLQGAEKGGCGQGLDNRPGEPGIDVGGTAGAKWTVTYQDTMEVVVKNGGAVLATHSFAAATGGTFDLEGTTIDLTNLCQRSDVACPNEVFPHEVTMTQPGNKLHLLYVSFNKEGPLGDLSQATLLGNVDSDDDFSIALGIGAATNGVCGLLSASYATGHIDGDGGDPPLGTSLSGDIVTVYTGGCLLVGTSGTAGAGLTIEVRIPFSATRQ